MRPWSSSTILSMLLGSLRAVLVAIEFEEKRALLMLTPWPIDAEGRLPPPAGTDVPPQDDCLPTENWCLML